METGLIGCHEGAVVLCGGDRVLEEVLDDCLGHVEEEAEGDEGGEDLLGEAGHVVDYSDGLQAHYQKGDQKDPERDPDSCGQKVDVEHFHAELDKI